MKKARIILSAIAVLAIVGGTFAFKASKPLGSVIYTTGSAVAAPNTLNNWTITASDFQGAQAAFATDVYNATAASTFITQRN